MSTVAWILADEKIHCVVVPGLKHTRGDAPRTWGVITDRDLMRALAHAGGRLSAADVASHPIVTVAPVDRLDRVAELMARHDVTHLLVTENDAPVGIISGLDVARAAGAG